MEKHSIQFRVYYEDTDSGGVVYYANYLKFAERARTELLRAIGLNQSALAKEQDLLFVVRNVNMELFSPAKLDDLLEITTYVKDISGAAMQMIQEVQCNKKNIAAIDVTVVCINSNFRPKRIPNEIKQTLTSNLC